MPQERSRSTTPTKTMQSLVADRLNGKHGTGTGSISPPRTPPRRRKEPPSSYPKSARLAAATGVQDRDSDDEHEDRHDLTYSARHIPRASMVDNMVMALDQFSTSYADRPYEDEPKTYRKRGHTFSSSVSSESDVRTLQTSPAPTPKPMRRSSARYTRDPSKLPSIFGEDEDSARVRIYESQRAAVPPRKSKSRTTDDAGTSESDLSHLKVLQGRLGPAGNRRSQSFDFGSRRREQDADIAPHPVIYSGPKAQKMPTSPVLEPSNLERRGSNISLKISKPKSTLGTSAVHGTSAAAVPSTPTGHKSPGPGDVAPSSRSGGLFKRFFGSSKPSIPSSTSNNTLDVKDSGKVAEGKMQKSQKDSVDIRDKENIQPALTKKPSSFFRRRKKSVSTPVVPPIPLTLDSAITHTHTGEQSPASSLKAFMDPYLAEDKARQRTTSPTSPLRSFYVPDSAGAGISRTESPEPLPHKSKLLVPQKETFLTDSSSCEGENNSDVDLKSGLRNQEFNLQRAAPRASSTTPHAVSTRPVIETRSSSWHSDGVKVPKRKESLPAIDTNSIINKTKLQRNTSGSDVSVYKSAPSTPAIVTANSMNTNSPRLHVSHPSVSSGPTIEELNKAQHIYNNGEDEVDGRSASAWLGEAGSERERIRNAYMNLYDWSGHTILAALRGLCSRLILKAESQLIDRILVAFARRWCSCNSNHGFKSADVVHTICYSILLLNTDLHMADIGSKMTRSQFIKNSMQTIRSVADEAKSVNSHLSARSNSQTPIDRLSIEPDTSRSASALGNRSPDHDVGGPLVEAPYTGSTVGWELQIEIVLKEFYFSIQREPLPLFGSEAVQRYPPSASNNNLLGLSSLRRTPSVLSKAQSESNRSKYGDSKSLGSKWNKTRSRQRLGSTPGFGSSKNSLEDQSSVWSPSISSTWSKASLGKTLTSMSVDSFATSGGFGPDYQSSIGFANALSQAIIRDDQFETSTQDSLKTTPLLEDESLELEGAPWAKEGMLKHKCHLEGVDKRSKDRQWSDCFAVIEKGCMRLFSFSVNAKSMRVKARNQKPGGVVGGGNWQDNAEEVWKFMLRHTIASSLPPPGYSKARPYVWALSLPTGAVHLFSVGTPDIVKEFVSTANYWSARLSKEPMTGGITSMEYGWSDSVINRALITSNSEVRPSFTSNDTARPSTQMSIRSSLEYSSTVRPKLPGDKIHISDWTPPTQSLLASQLMEVDQLKALLAYVSNVEEDLQRHNELRSAMMIAFSPKHVNYNRAMSNWEKKSSYLLREIVKFKNYIDALQSAQGSKDRILRMRQEEEKARQIHDESMALYAARSMST